MAYTTTTLADLQAFMVQRWDQVVFWTPEEARLALNETLREWNLLTGRWRTRVAAVPTPPSPYLPLPSTMTYGMRVITNLDVPLIPSSLTEFDLGRPSWRFETTASGGDVPAVPTLWAPVSLTEIAVWPAFATSGPNNSFLIDGVLRTPVLVYPTDYVDLGEEIIDYVVDMALHVAAFKEAAARWRATRPFFDAFLQAAAEENSLLKQNQKFRRWAGLDRRRTLQPTTGAPNQIAGLASEFSTHDTGGNPSSGGDNAQ
jgi:hypothetical protein